MEGSATSEAHGRPAHGGRLAVGLVLLFLGLWLGLDRLGISLPRLGDLWPAFPFLAGLAFLVALVVGGLRDPGLAFPGAAGVLVGVFFGLFTVGPLEWREMTRLWPCLPLLAGLAFLATWIAGLGRQPGLLVLGFLGVAVGLVGLVLTYGLVAEWLVPVVDFGWPVVLIVLGAFLVWRSLRGGASAE